MTVSKEPVTGRRTWRVIVRWAAGIIAVLGSVLMWAVDWAVVASVPTASPDQGTRIVVTDIFWLLALLGIAGGLYIISRTGS